MSFFYYNQHKSNALSTMEIVCFIFKYSLIFLSGQLPPERFWKSYTTVTGAAIIFRAAGTGAGTIAVATNAVLA